MIQVEMTKAVNDYSSWVSNESFAIATAAFLILCAFALVRYLMRQFFAGLVKRMDAIDKSIEELGKAKENAMIRVNEREIRLTKTINDAHEKQVESINNLSEKVVVMNAGINVLVSDKLEDKK